MQVILTEEEYLRLKNQHEEQRKIYVKRIDVSVSLQEFVKELANDRNLYDPITLQPNITRWQTALDNFWKRIDPHD